jgi:hypothetical protein
MLLTALSERVFYGRGYLSKVETGHRPRRRAAVREQARRSPGPLR